MSRRRASASPRSIRFCELDLFGRGEKAKRSKLVEKYAKRVESRVVGRFLGSIDVTRGRARPESLSRVRRRIRIRTDRRSGNTRTPIVGDDLYMKAQDWDRRWQDKAFVARGASRAGSS